MQTFVTGGSGFIGGHLIRRLVAEGHVVKALARTEDAAVRVASLGALPVPGDAESVDGAAMAGCEIVFHCAAWVGTWGDREAVWRTNVEGTRQVLAAARQAGVRRFVHVSSESALLDGSSFEGTDESHPYPKRFLSVYAETKAASEQLVVAANGDGFETITLRPRLVWGPEDGAWLPGLIARVRSGVFRWVDDGRHLGSTTNVRNLVEAMVLAMDHGRPGEIYFVTDGAPRSFKEFVLAYLATAGVTPKERTAPGRLMRIVAALVEGIWRLLRIRKAPPLNRVEVSMVSHPQWFDDSKAREELGYRPVVTFAEGMNELRGLRTGDA